MMTALKAWTTTTQSQLTQKRPPSTGLKPLLYWFPPFCVCFSASWMRRQSNHFYASLESVLFVPWHLLIHLAVKSQNVKNYSRNSSCNDAYVHYFFFLDLHSQFLDENEDGESHRFLTNGMLMKKKKYEEYEEEYVRGFTSHITDLNIFFQIILIRFSK